MKKSIPSILEPFVDTNGNITTVWYKFLTLYCLETSTGGVSDYNDLTNLPSIENKKLQGNLTLDDLNIQEKLIPGTNITIDENNKINAKEYKPGENIEITEDGVINATTEGGLGRFEVGDIGISPFVDEGKNLRRYLNGQVILQSQFVGFTAKLKKAVQTYPSLATTEDDWQAIKTNSKIGQVGKFVIDDTTGTIRLPCIVRLQGILDLSNIGNIKDESLPQHTHNFVYRNVGKSGGSYNGVGGGSWFGDSSQTTEGASSSTYQDNAPVQEEAIQYPYFIQVANGVVEEIDVSTEIQLNNPFSLGDYKWSEVEIENLSWLKSDGVFKGGSVYPSYYDWILENANAGKELFKKSTDTYTDYDWVVNTADNTFRLPKITQERVLIAKKEATDTDQTWYNVYSDGWIEQGGNINASTTMTTYDLILPMADTNYHISAKYGSALVETSTDSWVVGELNVHPVSTTQFQGKCTQANNTPSSWIVKGYANISSISTAMGLYFYVGETVQDANLINAANIVNNFIGKNGENLSTTIGQGGVRAIVETYQNGSSWYRIYSDGWCEQGGKVIGTGDIQVSLLKPYANTDYSVVTTYTDTSSADNANIKNISVWNITSTDFYLRTSASSGFNKIWQACGYIS